VIRIGRRSLKGRPLQTLAAAAFVAIFFFAVPFPLIIIAAGLIGFLGARAGHPAFTRGIAHGKVSAGPDGESLLGEAIPDHARPSRSRTMRVAMILEGGVPKYGIAEVRPILFGGVAW
jgi:chromate transporter